MDAIVGAIVLAIVSFLTMFTTIFKGKALREAVTHRFLKFIGGNSVLSHEDLKNHYIFTKFETLDIVNVSSLYSVFQSSHKYNLFKAYVEIIVNVNRESLLSILDCDLVNTTESQMQRILLKQSRWRSQEYNKRLGHYLQKFIINNDDIKRIVDKVEVWRRKELAVTAEVSIEILNYPKAGSLYSKLYTIFHQYALCMEIMVHSGAESFNKMNGDLEALLDNNSN